VTRVDLGRVERVINRPHVIDLRDDGWTLMHPPACHPDLFACPVNQAATRNLEEPPPQAPGRYYCDFDPDGVDWGFVIGEPATDSEGVDWAGLVAELRAAHTFRDDIAAALAPGRWRGFDGPDGTSKDEVLADVADALARYDEAVGP